MVELSSPKLIFLYVMSLDRNNIIFKNLDGEMRIDFTKLLFSQEDKRGGHQSSPR